jgi:branched-chain amino acid transport system substrate-binding protein
MSFHRRFGAVFLALTLGSVVGCSKDVQIGAIISETGNVAKPYGEQVRRGLDLALEEINAAGGFQGGAIQLLYRDDKSSAGAGAAAARDLILNEGVQIIIGAVSSPVTIAVGPICQEREVLLLSPSSSAPKITGTGEYVFRNYPSDVLEGTAMADFAKGLGVRRVAIFAVDNEYGSGLKEVFTEGFESRSRKIVGTFDITEGDLGSLPPMVEDLEELDPQAVYIVGYVPEMVALLRELHGAGIEAVRLATSSVTDQVQQQAGEAAEHLVFPRSSFDVNSPDPEVAAFVKAFRAKYSVDPDIYAAHGYDALKLIWQAMLDTGQTHPDEVRRGLIGLQNFTGAAGRTAFDERGDVVRYPHLFIVEDGESIPYEQFEQDGGELPVQVGS